MAASDLFANLLAYKDLENEGGAPDYSSVFGTDASLGTFENLLNAGGNWNVSTPAEAPGTKYSNVFSPTASPLNLGSNQFNTSGSFNIPETDFGEIAQGGSKPRNLVRATNPDAAGIKVRQQQRQEAVRQSPGAVNRQPAAAPSWIRQVADTSRKSLNSAVKSLDKNLGGWIPGGGTPNLLTEGFDTPTGQMRKDIEKLGVDPDTIRVANLNTKRPFLNKLAKLSYDLGLNKWGQQEFGGRYAGKGAIGIKGSVADPALLAHEMGHAIDKNWYADKGRAIQVVNRFFGNPPIGRAIAGLALFGDGAAEDFAEKFHGEKTGTSKGMYNMGLHEYGDDLREEGQKELETAAFDSLGLNVLNPRNRNVIWQIAGPASIQNAASAADKGIELTTNIANYLQPQALANTNFETGERRGPIPHIWEASFNLSNALTNKKREIEYMRNGYR